MNDFPGNPYATHSAVSATLQENEGEWGIAQAIMAATYELRTANLIAMQAPGITDMSDWHPDHSAEWIKRANEIGERTGGEK